MFYQGWSISLVLASGISASTGESLTCAHYQSAWNPSNSHCCSDAYTKPSGQDSSWPVPAQPSVAAYLLSPDFLRQDGTAPPAVYTSFSRMTLLHLQLLSMSKTSWSWNADLFFLYKPPLSATASSSAASNLTSNVSFLMKSSKLPGGRISTFHCVLQY